MRLLILALVFFSAPAIARPAFAQDELAGLSAHCELQKGVPRPMIVLTNNSRSAVSSVLVSVHYILPGRSVPHFTVTRERKIKGGIEPGESTSIVAFFESDHDRTEFYESPRECAVVAVIMGFDDAAGKPVKYRTEQEAAAAIKPASMKAKMRVGDFVK